MTTRPESVELRWVMLQATANMDRDTRFSALLHTIKTELGTEVNSTAINEALWFLITHNLAFFDNDKGREPGNWNLKPTDRGREALSVGDMYVPDDPERYIEALERRVDELDDQIKFYAAEALRAYEARAFVASTVMIGVASERAFQLLGEAFLASPFSDPKGKFRDVFSSPRSTYWTKLDAFRRQLEPRKSALPDDLAWGGLALTLDSVLDLLRVNRNEAGHPTGRSVGGDEAYTNLQVFARFLPKLERLRAFFISPIKAD